MVKCLVWSAIQTLHHTSAYDGKGHIKQEASSKSKNQREGLCLHQSLEGAKNYKQYHVNIRDGNPCQPKI